MFLTFMIFCVALEAGLRVYFWVGGKVYPAPLQIEQKLGWMPPAFNKSISRLKGFDEVAVVSTVRDGFRVFGDPKTSRKKIWVIGDSFTQATAASDGRTYYDYIAQHADVELFAFGCGGYGSLQEYMILDRFVDEIRPDIILWQFSGNDLVNNDYEIESRSRVNNNRNIRPYWRGGRIEWLYPREVGAFPPILTRYSYLIRFLAVKWNSIYPGHGTIEEKLVAGNLLLERSEASTVQIMSMAKRRAGKAPVVAFLADDGWQMGDANFKRIAEVAGITYIAGVPDMIRKTKAMGYKVDGMPHDSHWSPIGHRAAGQYLLKKLFENQYLSAAEQNSNDKSQ